MAVKSFGRRSFLLTSVASALATSAKHAASQERCKLLFIHGRAQQGKDKERLKAQWLEALRRGAAATSRTLSDDLEVDFPFYGNTLDDLTRQFEVPLTPDIQTKGAAVDNEFLQFQAAIAEDLRKGVGITDAQIDAEYGANPKTKGPENWEWVQAILRTLDKHGGGLSQAVIETFMRDVFLYTTRSGVRNEVDRIVRNSLSTSPTVIVSHSLGTVVAYNVLRSDPRSLEIPLFITLGSPLGIRAIRNEFRPLRHPESVRYWYNAFDQRDVVALYALDELNFPIQPKIHNDQSINNHTRNRHGIDGYLDSPTIVARILNALKL